MNLDHSYATQLGDLGALTKPLSVANPQLIEVNHTSVSYTHLTLPTTPYV